MMFQRKLVDKIRKKYDQGSIVFLASQESLVETRISNIYHKNLIGTVEISPFDFKNTTMEHIGSSRKLYLADLAIRSDMRKLGVATQLLNEVENYAHHNNFDEIYLHVEVFNEPARQLYMKKGYMMLPQISAIANFTESHLMRPFDTHYMLYKDLSADITNHYPEHMK